MSVTKIELRIEADNAPKREIFWEIGYGVEGYMQVTCNGVLIAGSARGMKPIDGAYETMLEQLQEAFNKITTDAIVEEESK